MIKALMTAFYSIPPERLKEATEWYAHAFEQAPYFEESFYVGFNIAGYELGLLPKEPHEPQTQLTGSVPAWGVADINEMHERCLKLGAKELEAPNDVGGDIRVSRLHDPFGNILAFIQNPHFPHIQG